MSHTAGAQTTNYTWDVARGLPVVLQDGTNTYVYGLDLISATDGSGNQTYYSYDGLGSTTDLTDGSAVVTDTYTYDVFGAATHVGSSANVWQFTGEQEDGSEGLYYLRARYYDPATGGFLTRDPFPAVAGMPQSLNRYAYGLNNPVLLIDPYGLFGFPKIPNPIDAAKDAVGAAVNAAKGTVSSVYHDPAGAVKYLDGVAFTIDLYAAAITDTAAAIGCTTLGPGGCVVGYLAGVAFVAPGLLVSNGISLAGAVITCLDWTGVIGDKEGSSFTDCAVSASTAYVGISPEPNINAAAAGYQVCYDAGGCDAWWNYGPWNW